MNKDGDIIIQILAKPGAKSNGITDISEDGVGVQIAGKAVDGEANSELLKYMTSVLSVKKNEISLDKVLYCLRTTHDKIKFHLLSEH